MQQRLMIDLAAKRAQQWSPGLQRQWPVKRKADESPLACGNNQWHAVSSLASRGHDTQVLLSACASSQMQAACYNDADHKLRAEHLPWTSFYSVHGCESTLRRPQGY